MSDAHILFGGKCILFSGDFRQILPAVPKASRRMIVHMFLLSSFSFSELHVQNLTENMRPKGLKEDPNAETAALKYPKYLLSFGEGRHLLDEGSNIPLPPFINVVQSSSDLVNAIFGEISTKYSDTAWLTSKAILTTTNSKIKSLNDEIIDCFQVFTEHVRNS